MLGQTLLLIWLAVILQPSLNDAFRDFFPIETAIKPAGFTRNDAGDAGNGKVTA
jgi:Na+/citrate or Na+/malate symporter